MHISDSYDYCTVRLQLQTQYLCLWYKIPTNHHIYTTQRTKLNDWANHQIKFFHFFTYYCKLKIFSSKQKLIKNEKCKHFQIINTPYSREGISIKWIMSNLILPVLFHWYHRFSVYMNTITLWYHSYLSHCFV